MSMCHSWLMFPKIMSQPWPMGSPYMFCSVLDCLTNEVPQVQWSSVTPRDGGSGSVSAPSERGIKTAAGKTWTAVQVTRVRARHGLVDR
jgi:hypothetical protein